MPVPMGGGRGREEGIPQRTHTHTHAHIDTALALLASHSTAPSKERGPWLHALGRVEELEEQVVLVGKRGAGAELPELIAPSVGLGAEQCPPYCTHPARCQLMGAKRCACAYGCWIPASTAAAPSLPQHVPAQPAPPAPPAHTVLARGLARSWHHTGRSLGIMEGKGGAT